MVGKRQVIIKNKVRLNNINDLCMDLPIRLYGSAIFANYPYDKSFNLKYDENDSHLFAYNIDQDKNILCFSISKKCYFTAIRFFMMHYSICELHTPRSVPYLYVSKSNFIEIYAKVSINEWIGKNDED